MGDVFHPTVWMHAEAPAKAACAGCVSTPDGPACRTQVAGQPCLAPHLVGTATALQRVLDSLREVVDPAGGGNIVDLHWVKALRIADGEAELTVTFPLACGSARQLAEDAFQAMRRQLPDTDIYVRHAA